jgi:hypothetical protein
MRELDITELEMINGGTSVAEDAGWVIGRTVGLLSWYLIGKYI